MNTFSILKIGWNLKTKNIMTSQTKTLFAFITIFVIGFLSGYLFNSTSFGTDKTYTEERSERVDGWQQNRGQDRQHEPDSERLKHAQNRLTERLELTEQQQDPFFEKIREYHQDIRRTMRELRTEESEIIQEKYKAFREEVSVILHGEQLERMDSFLHPDSVRFGRSRADHQRGNR
jgi:hypothetical protein